MTHPVLPASDDHCSGPWENARPISADLIRKGGATRRAAPEPSNAAPTDPPEPQQSRLVASLEEIERPLTFLFFAISPLALTVLGGNAIAILVSLLIAGVFIGGLWLISMGLAEQKRYDSAEIARMPRHSYRRFGAGLIALVICVLNILNGVMPFFAVLLGGVGYGLTLLAFGRDPLADKGLDDPALVAHHKVNELATQAEAHVVEISNNISKLQDAEIDQQVIGMAERTDRMIDILRANPALQRSLRKHLTLYLTEALEVARKYAAVSETGADPALREEFLGFIQALNQEFDDAIAQLTQNGAEDLRLRMTTLKERFQS